MSNIKVITEYSSDIIAQSLKCDDDDYSFVYENRVQEVLRLKELGVREALIKLGWTPPKDR